MDKLPLIMSILNILLTELRALGLRVDDIQKAFDKEIARIQDQQNKDEAEDIEAMNIPE